jgi:hypothetical protein
MNNVERRRVLAKKAWAEAFARMFELAGPDWPMGSDLRTPELDTAEKAANEATEAYVVRGVDGARSALAHWEALMVLAIKRAKAKRGCHVCGVEKIAEVVDKDGARSCGRCRRGEHMG